LYFLLALETHQGQQQLLPMAAEGLVVLVQHQAAELVALEAAEEEIAQQVEMAVYGVAVVVVVDMVALSEEMAA
jgi:hypothetical protein